MLLMRGATRKQQVRTMQTPHGVFYILFTKQTRLSRPITKAATINTTEDEKHPDTPDCRQFFRREQRLLLVCVCERPSIPATTKKKKEDCTHNVRFVARCVGLEPRHILERQRIERRGGKQLGQQQQPNNPE